MNSLNSWLPTQWILFAGLLLVVGLILTLVAIYARRAVSRPHVKGLARNGRQSRLGLVDSYAVDRDRQLVLVRRDNVEHLIMIGGPNDLLVESTILKARAAGQASRPAGAPVPPPAVTPERVTSHPSAPRQVEEDFARPAEVELPPVARIEPPTPAPAAVTTPEQSETITSTAEPLPSAAKPSVVPPREPGFFQRASSRFQTFKNAPASSSAPAAQAQAQILPEEEEPPANIDTAHFEELLGSDEAVATPSTTSAPAEEFHFEGTDIEPAPEEAEPATAAPEPTATRLTLPEIRLPDLKLPQWRRPEAAASAEPAATTTPRPVEPRTEPRFSPSPRPLGGSRIEPSLSTSEHRTQVAEAPARPEPFRIGERLTTPTRPVTTPAPAPTPAPAEPEDPFASLEEEMANLLGRSKDDGPKL
jgi:flagellar protein FliO/FliZ